MEKYIIYFIISSYSIEVCEEQKLLTMQYDDAYCEVLKTKKDSVIIYDVENINKHFKTYNDMKNASQLKRKLQIILDKPKDDIQIDSLWLKHFTNTNR